MTGAGKINHKPKSYTISPAYMELDGLKVRFATGGNPDGPTVLFLSPLPQSILCFEPTWSALCASANLVALDLPGFGQSEGGLSYMNFAAQSAFLQKFINKLGLSNIHIVAQDVGMPVALHYVLHREHRAKSILVGAGPSVQPSADGSLVSALYNYTLGHQVVEPYDFTAAIRTAAREFMPDVFIVLGPGTTLGGATAQALIRANWRGWRSKVDFQQESQTQPRLLLQAKMHASD